ncbi:MAG: hypothetical protein R2749_11440 [Acidimicrobiales bacterium]
MAGELDILVIQGTVSAEHVSRTVEPLNLKRASCASWRCPSSSVAALRTRRRCT